MKRVRRSRRFPAAARPFLFHKTGTRRAAIGAWLALCCLCGTGCEPRVALQGLITNLNGEPLPGVSVKVDALQAFGVSNGNGLFGKRPNLISVPPGTWELQYIKTGYTTAFQTVSTGKTRAVDVPAVSLWPLPAAKGVYVLEGLNYRAFTRATPDRYLSESNTPVFGLKQTPELILDGPPDLIISHKMVNYDWQLSKLEQQEVLRHGVTAEGGISDSLLETIWVAAIRLPIQAVPVDQPEQLLWRIKPSAPMGPGFYAVHWGALDGDATTEESVYLFGIADPDAAPETEVPAETEPSNAT